MTRLRLNKIADPSGPGKAAVCWRESSHRQTREEPPQMGLDGSWIEIPGRSEHRVSGHHQTAMERPQISRYEGFQAGLVAMDIDGKRVCAEKQPAQPFLRERDHVIGILLETGQLGVPLDGERASLEGRRKDAVGQQFERAGKIRRQHFDREAEAVVARERIE